MMKRNRIRNSRMFITSLPILGVGYHYRWVDSRFTKYVHWEGACSSYADGVPHGAGAGWESCICTPVKLPHRRCIQNRLMRYQMRKSTGSNAFPEPSAPKDLQWNACVIANRAATLNPVTSDFIWWASEKFWFLSTALTHTRHMNPDGMPCIPEAFQLPNPVFWHWRRSQQWLRRHFGLGLFVGHRLHLRFTRRDCQILTMTDLRPLSVDTKVGIHWMWRPDKSLTDSAIMSKESTKYALFPRLSEAGVVSIRGVAGFDGPRFSNDHRLDS